MAKSFPNLRKETDIHIQEAQRVPSKMDPKRFAPRHVIIKTVKVKERILKVAREKPLLMYKETLIRLSTDFSAETLQSRREGHDIFKVLNGKNSSQEFSTQQSYHSELKERSRVFQISKS